MHRPVWLPSCGEVITDHDKLNHRKVSVSVQLQLSGGKKLVFPRKCIKLFHYNLQPPCFSWGLPGFSIIIFINDILNLTQCKKRLLHSFLKMVNKMVCENLFGIKWDYPCAYAHQPIISFWPFHVMISYQRDVRV